MNPKYHDAKLTGISIQENGDISLAFAGTNGGSFVCMLRGVKHFCCDNFREGNTIFDRQLTESPAAMAKDLRKLLFALPDEVPKELASLRAQIESGGLSFYKLDASYGATVVAICERIDET
jgi:hypothetical protein